jgi:hypothetical protein
MCPLSAPIDSFLDHRRFEPGANLLGRFHFCSSPLAWFLPGPFVCGGAQRVISLATGSFTGESRWNPPARQSWKKRPVIKGLWNHDLGLLDSFVESRESSFRKPLWPESSQQKPPVSIREKLARVPFEAKSAVSLPRPDGLGSVDR